MAATLTSILVLLANVIATTSVRVKYTPNKGVVTMYEGSCSFDKNVDTVLHLFINILSTLLLGASNLCMQILAAPTRKEVDRAHSKKNMAGHRCTELAQSPERQYYSTGHVVVSRT